MSDIATIVSIQTTIFSSIWNLIQNCSSDLEQRRSVKAAGKTSNLSRLKQMEIATTTVQNHFRIYNSHDRRMTKAVN